MTGERLDQARAVVVLSRFAEDLHFQKTPPDIVILRGSDHVGVARRQDLLNFLLRVADSRIIHGVRRKQPGNASGLAPGKRLQPFKDVNRAVRIVAGRVHVLQSEVVSLALIPAAETQKSHRDDQPGALPGRYTRPSAQYNTERNAGDIGDLAFRRLAGHVAGRNMGNLVSHGAGELILFLSHDDQPGIHKNISAGKRKRVEVVGFDYLEGKRHLRVGIPHQILADTVYIFSNDGVGIELGLPQNFLGKLPAEGNLLFTDSEIQRVIDVANRWR